MSDKPEVVDLVPQRRNRSWNLMPGSYGEAMEIANVIARSDFAPKDYKGKPENVMLAIQMGADVGLSPMQALQNIAVINGRPSIWGDAALALVMPALERFHETFEGTKGQDDWTAVCVTKRKGWPDEMRTTFSVGDAKKAGLWTKSGPWTNYPDRMLMWRARGFNLRSVGADLLLGLVLAEEAGDYPTLDGTVVVSEVVPPAMTAFDKLPEAVRDNLEKAFAALNMNPAQRLTKLNEYLGAENAVPEEAATALLEWCRDEFAKRKTGQPRAKKDGDNGRGKPGAAGDGAPAVGSTPPRPVEPDVRAASSGGEGTVVPGGDALGPPALTADEIFAPAKQESELF